MILGDWHEFPDTNQCLLYWFGLVCFALVYWGFIDVVIMEVQYDCDVSRTKRLMRL